MSGRQTRRRARGRKSGSVREGARGGEGRREPEAHTSGASATTGAALPQGFAARVLADLGPEDGEALLAALRLPPQLGLRVNSRMGSAPDVLARLGWPARHLPWAPEGVVLAAARADGPAGPTLAADSMEAVRETRQVAAAHPWHDAGAYYLQDPAAMGVVPVLDPRPGERVLDLAAAPGGKSTYLADRLAGTGLLWSHDVDKVRVGAVVGNLERWGVPNAVVSHGPVARLAPLNGVFDRVLLDAPCSGEGMFRKSRAAAEMWSHARVADFVALQARLLDAAVDFLKPGGVLVYSTCTFGPEENEAAIAALLQRRPEVAPDTFTAPGAGGGLEPHTGAAGLQGAVARWWPHLHAGEGHFVARLRKSQDSPGPEPRRRHRGSGPPGAAPSRHELAAFETFAGETLGARPPPLGPLRRFGEWLHALPDVDLPDALTVEGFTPRRVGTPLGRYTGGRFQPHHALSRLLPAHGATAATLDLDVADPRVDAYLRGEVVTADATDGWVVVRAGGLPLGWAKATRGELNNHLPKGLRRG